jgi:NADH dehydrogenase [ubiquinone] 1 alpha subcomplex assembly factor 5
MILPITGLCQEQCHGTSKSRMEPLDPHPLPAQQVSDIFDRQRIRLRRASIGQREHATDFLLRELADQMLERLQDVQRTWSNALMIGWNPALEQALSEQDIAITLADPASIKVGTGIRHFIQCDMDRIYHGQEYGPFDLILWPGGLESTNDVPGALAQCRRLLKPDGVLLGAFYGAGCLPILRHVIQATPEIADAARFHPQIDARAMGDLLQRTGFALPTVDIEKLQLSYRQLTDLIADLRGAALTNSLNGSAHSLSRVQMHSLNAAFLAAANDDGRIVETMVLTHFIAWGPHESQPKPARRGSATTSLQSALGAKPQL